jgi:hypothetical protein
VRDRNIALPARGNVDIGCFCPFMFVSLFHHQN